MDNSEQTRGIVLSAIIVLSTVAMGFGPGAVVAADGPAPHDERQFDQGFEVPPADRIPDARASSDPPNGTPPAGDGPPGRVADDLENANGTVEVVVRLEEAEVTRRMRPEEARRRMASVAEQKQKAVLDHARSRPGIEVLERFWITNAVLLRVDTDRVDLADIADVEGVTRLHPNFEVRIPNGSVTGSNDSTSGSGSSVTTQGTTADGYNVTYGVDRVNATDVWEEYDTRGGGVKVAVLDTGINIDHPDLSLYTEDPSDPTYPGGWAEFDAQGDRVEGSTPHDEGVFYGHGSHVSGTIAGGNASGEYIGVAPNVSLMHGLVLPGYSGTFAQIVAGMEWAVENDADVLSMSLGATGYYPSFIEPIRNAQAAGTIVVAAEGNERGSTGTPGAVYEAISVGVTDEENEVPFFGGGVRVDTREEWYPFAPEDWPDEYVVPDVVAPGVSVKSATRSGFSDQYYESSGTSMSTPHVAGAIALALSAAGDTSLDQAKDAVISSGWKPADCDEEFGEFGLDGECRPNGTDIGYGYGIVDAETTVDRLAADSGVTGTVTDPNGDPVAGATVELDNFDVETDSGGTYRLREDAGTYAVTADGFGYAPETKTATVTAGNVTDLDFTLNETLALEATDPQAEALVPGNETTVSVRAAHVESWTVTRSGDYSGDATVSINGRQVDFGETVRFDDYTGPVNVTVSVPEGAETGANLTLRHSVTGAGESATVTTGPTLVTDRIYQVAVVGAFKSGYAPDVQLTLEDELPRNYEPSFVEADDAADVADQYDVFVVQNFGSDPSPELVREFKRATDDPGTGVIYLDQGREAFPLFEDPRTSDAISQLERATNDPRRTAGDETFATDELDYAVERDHPIFDGIADPGENVTIQRRESGIGYSTFEEFTGQTLAQVSLPEGGFSTEPGPKGPGFAIDERSRTVLAASLGRYRPALNDQFTNASDEILANSVVYLSREPQATVADGQPERVDPGQRATTTFEVTDLQTLTVSVADRSTLSADEVQLYVDGRAVAPGETVQFDEYTGEVSVSVASDGANGSVALETTFESAGAENALTVLTGPTAVYEPPLVVGRDVESMETAMTMVRAGDTMYVANGTYVDQPIADVPGLTITALSGADPVVTPPGEMERFSAVLRVEEPDVTIAGLRVELDARERADSGRAVEDYYGIGFYFDSSGATVRDVVVDGAGTGIGIGNPARSGGFEPDVRGSTISDVRINDTVQGIQVGIGTFFTRTSGLRVEDTRITNVEPGSFFGNANGIFHEFGVNVTYANVTVENCEKAGFFSGCTGFSTFAAWATTFEDGTITNAQTAIDFGSASRKLVVRNNTITDSSTGVYITGDDFQTGRVVGNDISAETGVAFFFKETPTVAVHYNDLSNSTVAMKKLSLFGFFPPPEYDPDVRLNYYGPRGPTTADDPETLAEETRGLRYDPFLTAPPEKVVYNRSRRIATDLELPANETRTIGVPGPTDQTVADVLGSAFNGTVEMYDAENDTWTSVRVGSGVELRALDVLRVTPEEDTVAVLTFRTEPGSTATDGSERADAGSGAGPGDEPPANSGGRVILDRGTNVVSAATYGPAESGFVTPSGAIDEIAPTAGQPTSQLGAPGELDGTHQVGGSGDGPRVSPFTGYYVDTERPTPVEVSLEEDPTVYELYEQLGLETPQITGLNTNLTEASSFPEPIVTTGDASEAATTLARLQSDDGQVTAADLLWSRNTTTDRLVRAAAEAIREAVTKTGDPAAIREAGREAIREEADRIGVDLTEETVDDLLERALRVVGVPTDSGGR